jgi:hypothetical protein
LLFELLNRGQLGDWCHFLSDQSSRPSAEKFLATGVNDFFSRAHIGIDAAEKLRGTL